MLGRPRAPALDRSGRAEQGQDTGPRRRRAWRPPSPSCPTGTVLAVIVGLLCVIGLVMVGSASSVVSISLYGSPWAILIREAMWMGVGVDRVRRGGALRPPQAAAAEPRSSCVVTFGLLVVVLVPGLGVHVQGSSRWIGFGQFRLQPSELMKLALTVFAADLITRRLDEGADGPTHHRPAPPGHGLLPACSSWRSRTSGRRWCSGASPWPCCSSRGSVSGPSSKSSAVLVVARRSWWPSSRPTGATGSVLPRSRRPTDRARATRCCSR